MKKTILLIIIAIIFCNYSYKNDNIIIPSSSIRIRVIASSNNKKDQEDKLIIKSALEEKIYNLLKNKKNYDEVDNTFKDNEEYLENYLREFLSKNNIDSNFKTNYGYNYFPEKTFKGVKYNSGLYKSYVVTLGDGEGDNWWCVMYPPLCLIDENMNEYTYHFLIKDTIEQYT